MDEEDSYAEELKANVNLNEIINKDVTSTEANKFVCIEELANQENRNEQVLDIKQFDIKVKQKRQRHTSVTLPTQDHTYGRALRPQTPVDVVMANAFGEAASKDLQSRYIQMKSYRNNTMKCPTKIPLTNAQAHADQAVRAKIQGQLGEPRQLFKLNRFQNVEPRTSTKRGEQGYMVKAQRSATQIQGAATAANYESL